MDFALRIRKVKVGKLLLTSPTWTLRIPVDEGGKQLISKVARASTTADSKASSDSSYLILGLCHKILRTIGSGFQRPMRTNRR